MHTEYEVRVLNVNVLELIDKLEKLNAHKEWDCLQRRYVYDFIPKVDGKWIRLRTNGKKTTLTIKNLVSSEIDGTQELEVEVDNFEKCNLMLNELGYEARSYQENRRIQYVLKDNQRFDYLQVENEANKYLYKSHITTREIIKNTSGYLCTGQFALFTYVPGSYKDSFSLDEIESSLVFLAEYNKALRN